MTEILSLTPVIFYGGTMIQIIVPDFVNKFPMEKVKDVQHSQHFFTSSHISITTRVISLKYHYKVFHDLATTENPKRP